MISLVDPIKRLDVLSEYMSWWIDKYPRISSTFDQFFYRNYPELIPGTVDHTKIIATHCFYCDSKFTNEGKLIKTIDHYEPSSKYRTEKFVISCFGCNNSKGNTDPVKLTEKMFRAEFKGLSMWGHSGKKLKHIATQIQKITNDRLWNMGPRI